MAKKQHNIWEKTGSTGMLRLDSGPGNYLADPEFIQLEWLKDRFSDPELKGIVITGSGRHFSAGADLRHLMELATDEALLKYKIDAGKEILRLIEATPLPVVAEIKGACFGGGLEIALACHIRICSENALFAFPEVNHGIMPGLGGTTRLPQIIGSGKATQMLLSGDILNAEKALELKLVDHVVPARELHDFTLDYLERLTRDRDVVVIRSIMQSIQNALHMDTDRALKEETKLFCELVVQHFNKPGK